MKFNNTQRIATQHAASAVLGYKKTPSLFYIEKTSPARVTTSVRSCLAAKTSSGTANSIPFRYNRRSCHCLPVSIKRDIRIPLIAFKPGQQCLSEAIFHLRLHIPLSLGTLAQNESSHFTLLHIHKRNRFIICVQKSPPGISL